MAPEKSCRSNLMAGKICLVTGGTDGIGRVTALELANMGANVIIVGRNSAKSANAAMDIREQSGNFAVEFLVTDLSSQSQVRQLAKDFKARHQRLDVLVNNAGAFFVRQERSVDGIEMTFALNHLSYYLLTNLLLNELMVSAPSRIVNVSSGAHKGARIEMCSVHRPNPYLCWRAYSRSKLCNLLFTYELARQLEGTGVTVNALHPGLVRTNILNNNGVIGRVLNFLLSARSISVESGALTSVYAATSPEMEGVSGKYLEKSRIVRSSKLSYDEAQAAALWELSAKLTGLPYDSDISTFLID